MCKFKRDLCNQGRSALYTFDGLTNICLHNTHVVSKKSIHDLEKSIKVTVSAIFFHENTPQPLNYASLCINFYSNFAFRVKP